MIEIFSEVRAILSSNVINIVDGPVEDTLRKWMPSISVLKLRSDNIVQYCLLGTLEEIITANSKLQDAVLSQKCTNDAPNYHLDLPITVDKENNYLLNQNTLSSHKSSSSETPIEKDPALINEMAEMKRKTKRLRIVFNERPRSKPRSSAIPKSIHRHRYPKRKHVSEKRLINYETEQDSDALIKNLEEMKLSTENSSDGEHKVSLKDKLKKNYEAISPYKYFCELCSFKTKRSSHFSKHMSIHEKVKTLFRCSQCSFTSVRLSHLRRHEMSHSSTVHSCSQCHYKTDDDKFLSRHVRLKHCNSHKNDKKHSLILSCSYCSYHTTKQRYFERHQRMHCSKDKNILHQCEKCCYKTHRKEHFVRHVNNVHGNKRPYLCQHCGKTFKRGDALLQHQITHSNAKATEYLNFKCDICDKVFRSQSHLTEHKAIHSDERAFLCEVCGASFKTRSVQRKHVLTIHVKPRAFVCRTCSKRFNTMFSLKRHEKLHNCKEDDSETEGGECIKIFNSEADQTKQSPAQIVPAPDITSKNDALTGVVPVAQEVHSTLDTISLPMQTAIFSGTEVMQQITPTFFQPSENTTTLLYLTNGLAQF